MAVKSDYTIKNRILMAEQSLLHGIVNWLFENNLTDAFKETYKTEGHKYDILLDFISDHAGEDYDNLSALRENAAYAVVGGKDYPNMPSVKNSVEKIIRRISFINGICLTPIQYETAKTLTELYVEVRSKIIDIIWQELQTPSAAAVHTAITEREYWISRELKNIPETNK